MGVKRQEGGWGWAVVVGCFINQLLFEGLVRSYGFIYLTLQERYGGSAMATSWIQACFSGIAQVLGPVASLLTERYSCRVVVVCGGALIGSSLVISALTPNLYFLYFSYSLIGGVGGSLIYSPMFVIVSQYFDQKRGIALGVASIGAAVGTFAVPGLVRYLLQQYGFTGCLLIVGAVMMNHCVSGCLYRSATPPGLQDDDDDSLLEELDDGDDVVVKDFHGSVIIPDNYQKPMISALPSYLQPNAFSSNGSLDKRDFLFTKPRSDVSRIPGRPHLESESSVGRMPRRRHLDSESSRVSKRSVASSVGTMFESALSLSFVVQESGSLMCDAKNPEVGSSYASLSNPKNARVKVVVSGDTISTSQLTQSSDTTDSDEHPLPVTSKFVIFKNPSYLLFCFEIFSLSSTILPNFVFLPPLAKEKGLSEDKVSVLLAFIGGAGFIGTFVIGFLFDLSAIRRHRRVFYAGIGVFHGLATISIALAPGFITMVVAACCCGFVITSLIGQRANAASHYVTVEQLPFAFGVMTMFQGLGFLKDRYDTFKPCFVFGGMFLAASSLLVITDYGIRQLVTARRLKQRHNAEAATS